MSVHITSHREGFGPGLTAVTSLDDATGIALTVHRLAPDESFERATERETAWLLMDGALEVSARRGGEERAATLRRGSLFDELPSAVHVSAGTTVAMRARTGVELTVYETTNRAPFAPAVYLPADVRDEHRGKGQVKDACYRFVRTIFDRDNAPAAAELVLGEVITLPGRWSSYPPHHHAQPEIYHYRFTAPQGYGHAELGEQVLKVRHGDTVKILDLNDHAQVAAPGYGMYYAWVIRHLPERPYGVPDFTEEHRWIMQPGASMWWPRGLDDEDRRGGPAR